jgi:uncharacterized protein YbcC (UPF0753/DUF2309 family)
MKWRILTIIFAALVVLQLLLIDGILAEEKKDAQAVSKSQTDKKDAKAKEESEKPEFTGFVDKNKDGINDKFHDVNGDGVNDVTKEKYNHRFKFVDKNKDKINDMFVDKDGDGVNDLETKFADQDKDKINDNVLDYDKDGINDITGLKYKNEDLMGYRYGIVEEEMKKTHKSFIDENGDGMHDVIARQRGFCDEDGDGIHDRFVDEDGDGICDGRHFGMHRRRHGHGGMQRGRQARVRRRGGK